jgi:exopolysaccharide biosynthesis polyprenyl glycosylphosphotransferase
LRFFLRHIKSKFHEKNIALTNVLIVGNGDLKKRIVERLQSLRPYGVRILNDKNGDGVDIPLSSLLNGDLKDHIVNHSVHELFIIEPGASCDEILEFVSGYQKQKIKFRILADIFRLLSPSLDVEELDQIPTLGFRESKPYNALLLTKRVMDIILVVLLLPISLPLFLIVALGIKIDSRGPVLIKQKRVGRDKKLFTLFKFRTMHMETKLYEYAPLAKNDARVTRVGKFLRRLSLDELPQLLNILIGNMSFVGPRPEMPFIVSSYKPWQEKRLLVKPGLTGLWQILGRKNIPLHENLQLDFYYINNQSIYLDLNILLKTVPAVAFGRGAY